MQGYMRGLRYGQRVLVDDTEYTVIHIRRDNGSCAIYNGDLRHIYRANRTITRREAICAAAAFRRACR